MILAENMASISLLAALAGVASAGTVSMYQPFLIDGLRDTDVTVNRSTSDSLFPLMNTTGH